MKRFLFIIATAIFAIGMSSCDISNKKIYEGPDQVAFQATSAAVTLTADKTTSLNVQLISGSSNDRDIVVNIALSGTGVGTVVTAADVPTSVTIPRGKYSVSVPVSLHYAGATSTAQTVILTLSTTAVKVSGTLGVATISVKK